MLLSALVIVSILAGILLVGMIWTEQNGCGIIGSDTLDFIQVLGLYLGKWVILIVVIVASVLYYAVPFRQRRGFASSPLLLNLGTLLISVVLVVKGPDFRYAFYQTDYDEFIRLVEEDKIEFDKWGGAVLPPEFQHLSSCGDAIQANFNDGVTRVFFFSTLTDGISFDGIVYRSDNEFPVQADYLPEGPALGDWKCRREELNWFYCENQFYLD
jgi:hypothetical protein